MEQTEAELESFRQQWKAEVTQKKHKHTNHDRDRAPRNVAPSAPASSSSKRSKPLPSTTADRPTDYSYEDLEPKAYHDLDERDGSGRTLDETEEEAARHREPESALEHYEKAVEREGQGNLGDSVKHYRQAFKLDPNVNEQYKDKHFKDIWKKGGKAPVPTSQASIPQTDSATSSAPAKPEYAPQSLRGLSSSMSDLLTEFSNLSIQGEEPPTDLSAPPPCPIASVPEELLIDILLNVAMADLSSFAKLALVCKRLAYLVLTEDRIWKRITCGNEYGFASQIYRYKCQISGRPLSGGTLGDTDPVSLDEETTSRKTSTILLSLSPAYPTFRHMFRNRPRIRFNGCYISTVNYVRPGGASATQTHNTWTSPVLIVTYYRYLRFFRDGSVVSLLTVAEPRDVVHHLSRENLHKRDYPHGLPGACMKDALSGRWRLSGPDEAFRAAQGVQRGEGEGEDDGESVEVEGDVHIETEGATPKYDYRLHLGFGSAGRGARNNKLNWKGYWSYNKLTDDWAVFALRNYQSFYWSRVKSYGSGL